MPWRTLIVDEVVEELMPGEVALMKNIAGDKAKQIVERVLESARGSIIAGGNRLGPKGSIPDQLRTEVIDIARWRWLVSFPSLSRLPTKERKEAHDEAKKLLEKIATGNPKVEVPEDAIATTAPMHGVKQVRGGRREGASSFDLTGTT